MIALSVVVPSTLASMDPLFASEIDGLCSLQASQCKSSAFVILSLALASVERLLASEMPSFFCVYLTGNLLSARCCHQLAS